MRSKGKHVLWPIYFDVDVSLREGRRVSSNLAVRNPRIEDIINSALGVGLKAELQAGASHPKRSWQKTGYVLVESKEPKGKVIKLIASKLSGQG